MKKIALVTDSASSLTVKTAPDYGVHLLQMPIIIKDQSFIEDVSITYNEFIEKLREGALPKTSQPAIGEAEELFSNLLLEYENIIVLPINKSLSSTYSMLLELSKNYDGKIYVADHRVVSGNQLEAVVAIKKMIDEGNSFKKICSYLEKHKDASSVYIAPYDISHLRRTGRTSAAKAFIANLLKLYPILSLRGEENFQVIAKVRGFRKAISEMIAMHKKDNVTATTHNFVVMQIDNLEHAKIAEEEIKKVFGSNTQVNIYTISPVIASHTGLKTVAICANQKYFL